MRTYRSNKGLKKRCSCARRSWETCNHPWFFTFQFKGRVERATLGESDREKAVTKFMALKVAIRNGTYVRVRAVSAPPAVEEHVSLATVASFYLQQHVQAKLSLSAQAHHRSVLRFLDRVTVPPGMALAQKPFRLITQEDIEIALAAKRQRTTETMTRGDKTWTRAIGGNVAANRMHAHLSALWNWAIQPKRAYADKTPFSYGLGRVPDELKKPKERGRDRRLEPGETEALLQHAGQHLHDCIVAALETGMRKGEILSLQWQHVRWLQNEIAIHWENTKTKHSRRIPISAMLRTVLVRRQKALPEGQEEWNETHFVFGDAVGGRVKDIRTAWDNTVLKAHGIKVARGHAERVSAENRARLREIDLNFHDLRHEAGSRKLESGWQLHDVALWLGHTKITTTSTYLNASTQRLHELNERTPLALVR
ncbi:MAG TPA: site-specific integrase [Vicinamibacterales bacterium]|nr:site-specific integrase [Vicinamibacterales bacterium]